MIRWKYFVPRLTLLALCVTFTLIAINPVLRWSIVRSGQAVTGARVDVDRVRANLWNSEIGVSGFCAADPRKPLRNLFDIGEVKMKIEPRQLTRRRIVVKEAEVTGLNLDTERSSSGALTEATSKDYLLRLHERFARIGVDWMESATACLQDPAPVQLQSSQLADELLSRWPPELVNIEQQAISLNGRLSELGTQLAESGENPLRNASSYQQAVVELGTMAKNMIDVRGELDRMEQQILMDQDAIQKARQNDQHRVREQLEVEQLDGEALSEYLLGEEVADRVVALVYWLRWGRQFLPALSQRTESLGSRGRDIYFEGIEVRPRILIENVVLRGARNINGAPFHFEGTLCGLSSRPSWQQQPTQLTVQTTSGTPCLIEASLQGTGKGARDSIRINCPTMALPARTLGNAKQLAIDVAAGDAHLWVELTTSGETLTGELILKQPKAVCAAHIDNQFQCSEVAGVYARSVESITELEVAVEIGGTLDHPRWTLRSNLGPRLSANLNTAVAQQLLVRDQESLRRAYAETDQRITMLTQELASKRAAIAQLLSVGGTEIERVRDHIASRVDRNDGLLDEQSPLRETLRR